MTFSISPEEELILLLSRTSPSPDAMKDAEKILKDSEHQLDIENIAYLSNMNGVSPLLYHNLNGKNLVPETFVDQLRSAFLLTVMDNTKKAVEAMRIITFLRTNGIESIPLKGPIASDMILGNPGLYPSGDIDILVRPADLQKARRILPEAGYREGGELTGQDMLLSDYHLVFHDGRNVLEVHWKLSFRYFEVPPDFWWQETGMVHYEGMEIRTLAPERYLLYLIFRLYRHAFRPLRFLVLAAEVVNRLGDRTDWPKLLASAGEYRMGRLTIFTLKLLRDLIGARIPPEVTGRRIYGYGLLKRFVLSGIFQKAVRIHLRMLLYSVLQDTPLDTLKIVIRRVFPDPSEVRLRYRLPAGSKLTYLYYFLNPLLLLFKKVGHGR